MKSPAFDYVRPDSVGAVLALLREHGDRAQILAGGQSLLAMLNLRLAHPELLIDIGALPGLRDIGVASVRDREVVRTGALVTHAALSASSLVATHLPLLAMAVPHIAHLAIRHAGTVGGSLALADPAAELPAVALALEADLVLQGAHGERVVRAGDFFQGLYTTARADDELLVAIEWPIASQNQRFSFLELSRRRGDFAMVGVAAALAIDAGRVAEARLAWFGVADRPVLARQAAQALLGARVDPAGAIDSAAITSAGAALSGDFAARAGTDCSSATRMHLAGVLLGRALRATGDSP